MSIQCKTNHGSDIMLSVDIMDKRVNPSPILEYQDAADAEIKVNTTWMSSTGGEVDLLSGVNAFEL